MADTSQPPLRSIGVIAGKGLYPDLFIDAASSQSPPPKLALAGFHGETDPKLSAKVDAIDFFRVGQLGGVIKFFKAQQVEHAIMVGQITPGNLFDLRPDMRTLLLLAKLKQRNAHSLFGAIANELAKDGIELLPATTFLDHLLPEPGHLAGPKRKNKDLEDARYAFQIARETSQLDIGQCVLVRRGTILAVEAFEGTNDCIRRAAELGRRNKITLAKLAKPNHDFRFDVPCIGPDTIRIAADSGVQTIAIEAHRTLLLDRNTIFQLCEEFKITLLALPDE